MVVLSFMKNALFALAVALLASATASAQSAFGVRLGYNATDVTYGIGPTEIPTSATGNFVFGAFLNVPLATGLLSLQPEVNYLNRGFVVNSGTVSTTQEGTVVLGNGDQTISYLDLGTLLRLNVGTSGPLGFYVGAGPYVSYAVSGRIQTANGQRDVDFNADRLRRGGLQLAGIAGLTAGVGGLDLFLEGRYQTALSDLTKEGSISLSRQRQYGLAVGVMVPFGK